MRDPMSWAIPVFRAFGIQVKVHIFFFVITIGLFLRVVLDKHNPIWWVDVFLFTVVVLFGIILLHEFGHAFGARYVGGDSKEILIWPLGGLAFVEVPHNWRANFLVAAAGPGVNVLICVAAAAGLGAGKFLPNLNPLSDPFVSRIHNFENGREYTSEYGLKLYKAGTAEPVPSPQDMLERLMKDTGWSRERVAFPRDFNASVAEREALAGVERALAPGWAVWLNRIFWLSWVLLLFNLLPAYPLDGGQMMQSLVWARTDYRRGVVVASYSGFVVSVVFLVVSIAANEALFMGLALFMLYSASMKLYSLEMEDGPFGYDFSAGYTSLERDDEPPPRPKKPGYFTRWWQARKARKLRRAAERRAQDEERKELLLEKIALSGLGSLTDDERRFLEQFSSRYRHRS
ncbi:MAG: Peptidase family [Gemmataceae bacterium]|nr:Peptidase family [Gemmataceae bacterium]